MRELNSGFCLIDRMRRSGLKAGLTTAVFLLGGIAASGQPAREKPAPSSEARNSDPASSEDESFVVQDAFATRNLYREFAAALFLSGAGLGLMGASLIYGGKLRHFSGEVRRSRQSQLKAENSLKEKETASHTLFDSNPRPMWIYDSESLQFLDVNKAAIAHYGYSREEFLSMRVSDICLPDDSASPPSSVSGNRQGDFPTQSACRHRCKDGSLIEVEISSHALNYGNRMAELAHANDVTERRQAEKALLESEDRYRDLVENSEDLICTHSLDGWLLSVNDAAVRLTGYSREKLLQMSMANLVPHDARKGFERYLSTIKSEGKASGVLRIQVASGEIRFWEYENSLRSNDVEVPIIRGVARDITVRKRAENALRTSQRLARMGNWELDVPSGHLDWSEEVYRIFEVEPADFSNTLDAFLAFIHPEDRARFQLERARFTITHSDYDSEIRIVLASGQIRHIHMHAEVVYGTDGRAKTVSGMVQDITERKVAMEKLERSEALLKMASEIARLGGWTIELPAATVHWSDAVCAIYEVPPGRLRELHEILEFYDPVALEKFALAVGNCLKRGEPFDLEVEITTAKGRRIWIRSIGNAERDSNGEIRRLQGAFQDITVQKLAGDALRASEHQLASAQRIARLGSYEGDFATGRLTWSDEIYRLFGAEPEDFNESFESFFSFLHPEDRDRFMVESKRALREGSLDIEHRIIRADGEVRHVHERAELVKDGAGRHVKISGTVQDITDRILGEEKLRRSESLLRIASRSARMGGWAVELPSGQNIWSDEVCALHDLPPGSSPDMLRGSQYYAPEWRTPVFSALAACIRDGQPFDLEAEVITAKNRRIWVRVIGEAERNAKGEIVRIQGACQDITDQKHTEAAQRRLLDVLDASLNEIYFFDPDTLHFRYMNHGARKNLGFGEAIPPDLTPLDFNPEFTRTSFLEMLQPLIRREKEELIFETVHQRTDSSLYPVEVHLQLGERENDSVFLAIVSDITERKIAEKALKENEALLHIASELARLGGWVLDLPTGNLKYSDEMCQILGLPRGTSMTLEKAIVHYAPEYHATIGRAFGLCFRNGTPIDEEVEIFTAKGERIWVRTIGEAVRNEVGMVVRVQGATQDITANKREEAALEKMEAQLRQAQKMEAVGQLAGGVAHDFNNMLTVILGHGEMALSALSPSDPIYSDIEEMIEAGGRSADLTRQLLAFARQQTIAPQVLDLNEAVEELLKMLRRLIGENIELFWKPGGGLGKIKLDPAQLNQILANLTVNARDAISGIGRITIETATAILNEEFCENHPGATPGDYLLLTFSDSGNGMEKETIDRIFEPFFTTKEVGKGTGLGLATVYGILKQNDGYISVESEIGQGTTFRIYLPSYDEGKTDPAVPSASVDSPRGAETILVVEDEAALLRLSTRILESLGYRVLASNTPDEAIQLAKDHDGSIDLLMTDVVMPKLSGRELSEQLRAQQPGIKSLFMSGYTADVIAHHGVLHEGVCFLQKPFTRESLATKVRETLDPA